MLAIFFHCKEKQFSFITRKNRVHKNRGSLLQQHIIMARGYGMALLAAISVAYLIHSSSAQTTYTVGDTTGWTVPQKVGRKMIVDPTVIAGAGDTASAWRTAAAGAGGGGAIGAGAGAGAKSSATSLGFAGFTTFLSIFVALCY